MSKSLDERPTRAEQDQAEATQVYRLAAEQGLAGAQSRLGVMYAEGWGGSTGRPGIGAIPTARDTSGRGLRRLAAEQGDAEAQAGLGLAYGAGRGVLQDFVALAYVDDSLCRTANWCDAKRRSEVSRYYCGGDDPRANRRSPAPRQRVGRRGPALIALNPLPASGRTGIYTRRVVVEASRWRVPWLSEL